MSYNYISYVFPLETSLFCTFNGQYWVGASIFKIHINIDLKDHKEALALCASSRAVVYNNLREFWVSCWATAGWSQKGSVLSKKNRA